MSFVANFRSKIDERRVRIVFPEMTDSETPVWVGSPCFFSMSTHYALAMVVLMIHLLFFWAAEGPAVEGGLLQLASQQPVDRSQAVGVAARLGHVWVSRRRCNSRVAGSRTRGRRARS